MRLGVKVVEEGESMFEIMEKYSCISCIGVLPHEASLFPR
jgi:hypothetical protein